MAIDFKRFQEFLRAPQEWVLIEEAKRGDKEAFGRLYQLYLDKIYRYILFQVRGRRELAEDLTADVFVKAWTKLNTQKGESFQAWLYKIARNTTIDYFRSKHDYIDLNEFILGDEDKPSLEDAIGKSLEIERVQLAMKKLTQEQQEILHLKFVEDLTNAEISQLLDKHEDAIRSMQYRAVKQLREELVDK